jgi:uncharacterized protein
MTTIAELTTEECLRLLETKTVGRIGMSTPSGQVIIPVNYTLSGDAIVFRTLPYGVVANNAHGVDVAFEVDSLDDERHQGWSVLATGRSSRIEDPGEVRMIRDHTDPEPWAGGQRNLYFKVEWDDLTGRRIGS